MLVCNSAQNIAFTKLRSFICNHCIMVIVLSFVENGDKQIWLHVRLVGQYLLQRPHAALDSSCTYFCHFGLRPAP